MSTLEGRASEVSHVTELLELAHRILPQTRDEDLIQKVTILREYLEFSQMNRDRDYGPILRRAAAELGHSVESHLKNRVYGDGSESKHAKKLPSSAEEGRAGAQRRLGWYW